MNKADKEKHMVSLLDKWISSLESELQTLKEEREMLLSGATKAFKPRKITKNKKRIQKETKE